VPAGVIPMVMASWLVVARTPLNEPARVAGMAVLVFVASTVQAAVDVLDPLLRDGAVDQAGPGAWLQHSERLGLQALSAIVPGIPDTEDG
jgi:hypothetical protein